MKTKALQHLRHFCFIVLCIIGIAQVGAQDASARGRELFAIQSHERSNADWPENIADALEVKFSIDLSERVDLKIYPRRF